MLRTIFLFLAISAVVFGDQCFVDHLGESVRISIAKTPAEVVKDEGKQILVAGFMTVYEDVPLIDLNPDVFPGIGKHLQPVRGFTPA